MPHERGNPEELNLGVGEVSREESHERHEVLPNGVEREPRAGAPSVPVLPVPAAIPQPVLPQAISSTASADDSALLAADEDLIEKEWVDKAKKIISDTRDDPHAREKAVGQLQAEYIRKRYGRIIGGQND